MQFIIPDIPIPVLRIVVIRRRTVVGHVAVIEIASGVVRCAEIFQRVVYDVRYLSGPIKDQPVKIID